MASQTSSVATKALKHTQTPDFLPLPPHLPACRKRYHTWKEKNTSPPNWIGKELKSNHNTFVTKGNNSPNCGPL